MTDVERRVTMAAQRFGQMRHMDNKDPTCTYIRLQLRLYSDDLQVGSVVPGR